MEATLTLRPHPSSSNPNKRPSLSCHVCTRPLFSPRLSPPAPRSFTLVPCQRFPSRRLVVLWIITCIFSGGGASTPSPGDRPSSPGLPCHYPTPPKQTEQVTRLKSVCLRLWAADWTRESLRFRGLHAQTICFPLAVI